ncbi:hypothetical protein RJ641_036912, partial [Dillenia turbinata]
VRSFHLKHCKLLKRFSSSLLRLVEDWVMGAECCTMNSRIERLPGDAKKVLQSLASHWDDIVDANDLQIVRLKGAMTNEVYQIKWPTKSGKLSRKVLVRIYGEGVEIFFDRENEIRTFEFLSKQGQGPRLLGRFSNGRVEEFIRARTLSAVDLRDPDISALIAAKLKAFHILDMPGPKNIVLWSRLRIWLDAAIRLSSNDDREEFRLGELKEETIQLEKHLYRDHQIEGFCHNDLQYGNIMMDEETRSITIIDYEYASYNPIAFDIANHFCEMAADYHTDTPHILDYSKYPGHKPTDLEMEELIQDVEKYTLASHLLWGLWGIISDHVNDIDFNYKEYARQRFQEYWSRKPELLGSIEAQCNSLTHGIDLPTLTNC